MICVGKLAKIVETSVWSGQGIYWQSPDKKFIQKQNPKPVSEAHCINMQDAKEHWWHSWVISQ